MIMIIFNYSHRVLTEAEKKVLLPKQVDREFKGKRGGWLLVTWLCLSDEKGTLEVIEAKAVYISDCNLVG